MYAKIHSFLVNYVKEKIKGGNKNVKLRKKPKKERTFILLPLY